MSKLIVVMFSVCFLLVGCGNTSIAKTPFCAFDFAVPIAHAETCSAINSPVFDVTLNIAGVGQLATTFAAHNYSVSDGERDDLAFWSIVELNNAPCALGDFTVDALPPHWVISLNAQCGTHGISGVAYGAF